MPEKTIVINGRNMIFKGHADQYLDHLGGGGEDNFIRFSRQFIADGSIVIDIGANIGFTSAVFSTANPSGRVYAVEPGRKNFEFLKDNIRTNSIENIVAVNAAISDSNGYQNFHENSAWGHLESERITKSDLGTTRVLTVDDFVAENKLTRCDLIKIDVEGFENHVFQGMNETPRNFNPRVVFEYNSFCMLAYGRTNPLEFIEMIGSKFKNIYRFTKDNNSSDLLQHVSGSNFAVTALHQNVVLDGSVNDFYVYN